MAAHVSVIGPTEIIHQRSQPLVPVSTLQFLTWRILQCSKLTKTFLHPSKYGQKN